MSEENRQRLEGIKLWLSAFVLFFGLLAMVGVGLFHWTEFLRNGKQLQVMSQQTALMEYYAEKELIEHTASAECLKFLGLSHVVGSQVFCWRVVDGRMVIVQLSALQETYPNGVEE